MNHQHIWDAEFMFCNLVNFRNSGGKTSHPSQYKFTKILMTTLSSTKKISKNQTQQNTRKSSSACKSVATTYTLVDVIRTVVDVNSIDYCTYPETITHTCGLKTLTRASLLSHVRTCTYCFLLTCAVVRLPHTCDCISLSHVQPVQQVWRYFPLTHASWNSSLPHTCTFSRLKKKPSLAKRQKQKILLQTLGQICHNCRISLAEISKLLAQVHSHLC